MTLSHHAGLVHIM